MGINVGLGTTSVMRTIHPSIGSMRDTAKSSLPATRSNPRSSCIGSVRVLTGQHHADVHHAHQHSGRPCAGACAEPIPRAGEPAQNIPLFDCLKLQATWYLDRGHGLVLDH